MTDETLFDQFAQVVGALDPAATLLGALPLAGGVSAQVTALEIARADGQILRVIVRRHGHADLGRNPYVAADEWALLRHLRAAGLPVPEPYAFDESGAILPTPYVVLAYVEGSTVFAPASLGQAIDQLADQLAAIHAVAWDSVEQGFWQRLTHQQAARSAQRPALLDESLEEGRIRDALEAAYPDRCNPPALLHGDFWPGNVLWRDGRLVAVIDWEDARIGEPLADLGNSRLEILWAFGAAAMERFTERYQASAALDLADLPYWDLVAALRPAGKLAGWALDAAVERRMRERHQGFVAQAFARLAIE